MYVYFQDVCSLSLSNICITSFKSVKVVTRDRSGTVVKVLCYKLEGRRFDPSQCYWNFSFA